jgi:hypothetical protein
MARSPLFDIFDPQGVLSQQNMLLGDEDEFDVFAAVDRKPQLTDLMPREEKSGLLSSLAQMGSSGLATAGWLLDTPGALVRGILAGDPLSVFGSSDDRVTGRELLRQYGMVGDEDTWGNFAGGVAAEAFLDPLTYMSLGLSQLGKGALGQAGKATQAAGLLRNEAVDSAARVNRVRQARNLQPYQDAIPTPRVRETRRLSTPQDLLGEIADPQARADALARLNQQFERFGVDPTEGLTQRLGVLDNFRIPGTNVGFEIGGGELGDRLARGFDAAGNWTKTAPVVGNITRTAAALFDPAVGDLATVSGDLQLTNELQFRKRAAAADRIRNQEDVRRAYSLLQLDGRQAQVPDVIPAGRLAGQAIPDELRTYDSQQLWNSLQDYATSRVAAGPTLSGRPGVRTSGDEVADWVLENVPEFRAIRDRFVDMGPQAVLDAREAGLRTPFSRSRGEGGFFPRQLRRFLDPTPGNERQFSNWGRDARAFSVQDNFGRSRDPAYDLAGGTRAFRLLTGNIDPRLDSVALRNALQTADLPARRTLMQQALDQLGQIDPEAFTFNGDTRPFQYILDNVYRSRRFQRAARPLSATVPGPQPLSRAQARMVNRAQRSVDSNYDRLATLVQRADPQFAEQGIGIFDSPSWNNALRYEMGRGENLANAEQLTEMLAARADNTAAATVAGGQSIPVLQAAGQLGFDPRNFRRMWTTRYGTDVTNFSIPENVVRAMQTLAPQSRLAPAEGGLLRSIDQFTNAFKVGALASPAFHLRNQYSGSYNAATLGAFNPFDYWAAFRAGQGDYRALQRRLATAPGYTNLAPDQRLRRFLGESGAQRVSTGNVISDVSGVDDPATVQGLYTGSGPGIAQSTMQALMPRGRGVRDYLSDFFSLRGVGMTRNPRPYNTNPLLAFNDAVGSGVEDTLRTGTFLNQIRKGVDPGVAGDITRMAQVDYAPEAFTSFERNFLKRVLPFYSFQKGILPSIADNTLYRPGGLQGQTIRAVTRGTEPSEDNFVPEHLRQSAAIPLPEGWPSLLGGEPADGLKRYLTNIDLPFESTLNLFTPGVGSSASSRITDSIQKTASNLLGQTNPLIKAPIEYVTNRQLYTGRELSDLYSILEQDIGPLGRPLEQAVVNFVPFGARGISLYRQLSDDRLDPVDARMKAAFNILAGVKLTDVDEERSKRMAARNMLNSILETTPGVRTYENLTVPEDALRAMPQEQQRLYLLYRVLQSEAAKKARERNKALDPLQVLGAVS